MNEAERLLKNAQRAYRRMKDVAGCYHSRRQYRKYHAAVERANAFRRRVLEARKAAAGVSW